MSRYQEVEMTLINFLLYKPPTNIYILQIEAQIDLNITNYLLKYIIKDKLIYENGKVEI